jgi:hypothetical protein
MPCVPANAGVVNSTQHGTGAKCPSSRSQALLELLILTAVTSKRTAFCCVILYGLVKLPPFRSDTLPPSSGLRISEVRNQQELRRKQRCALLAYILKLKMEAVYSSETLVNFYQTPRHHISILVYYFSFPLQYCVKWTHSARGVSFFPHASSPKLFPNLNYFLYWSQLIK